MTQLSQTQVVPRVIPLIQPQEYVSYYFIKNAIEWLLSFITV